MDIPRSSYYATKNHVVSNHDQEDKRFKKLIKKIYLDSLGRYGSPKICYILRSKYGELISEKRVARLMREMGLYSRTIKKYRAINTKNSTIESRPNIINQDFSTSKINEKWATDITYIHSKNDGWLYLSSITDLHSKKIISWDLSKNMTTSLVLRTLNRAVAIYKPKELIIHSDLGTQYTSTEYNNRLKELGFKHSFSRKGCPYDNAVIESFHASLKKEEVYLHRSYYIDLESSKRALFKYINGFYNERRINGSIGYMTPNEKEREALQQ